MNPAEMNGGWAPVGDDAAGWVSTYQGYDWKGRPTLTTNADGTTRENVYGGCGCAGGEVTTVRDEAGRRRKVIMDVQGRLKQVDELNWDQSVYATMIYSYNMRDQITQTNQAGQTRSFSYDGHGRLASRTTPEQGTTGYSYFADDSAQTVTDSRGATTTFSYNNRRLVTGITYGVPSGVAATPNVSFAYDAAGNRTSMTDGLGSVSYSYNTLSQLTSETRTFTGVGSFSLSYAYNLAGELNSITNPWSAQVGYNYDKIGRPIGVSGSGPVSPATYASSLSYRAFGLKQMAYGNSRMLTINYDNRLRMTRWDVAGVLGSDYEYRWEDTFRPTFAHSRTDATLDRWYNYDHVGRLHIGRTGSEARAAYGEPFNGQYDGPYSMGVYYDVWGNITLKEGWGGENPAFTATYTNNRRNGLSYDAAGNLTNDGVQNSYDATGQQATASYSGYLLQQYYDGGRLRGKKVDNGVTTYYLRSSVLGGQVVAELNGSGVWQRGYVYLGGELLAVQQNNQVNWVHEDPVTKSKRVTNSAGTVVSTIELDPWGGNTNRSSNDAFQPHKFTTYERDGNARDDAMHRRYNRWWSRFDQPDPYDGSYNATDPQSFNRYAYVQNDPVNFVDPTGLSWVPVLQKVCTSSRAVGVEGGEAREVCHYVTVWIWMSDGGGFHGGPSGVRGPQNPAPNEATGYTCSTISGGPLSVSGIVDSNAQLYPAIGLGLSWPMASYSRTHGIGPVQPGLHVYGSVSNILAVTLSTNVAHPITGGSRQVGYGTPSVGVGFQLVLPALQGTTQRDWEHHPDNPLGKGPSGRGGGRCPY
jgi:RHS repeat-associated protein